MRGVQARVQFADWLKSAHPEIYQRALKIASEGEQLSGLGQNGEPKQSFWDRFSEAATKLGTTYLTLKNQRDAMELNMQRAKQGLPPLDPATTAPVVRTQVDVSPQLAQKLTDTAGEGMNRMMLLGVAAIAAAFVIFGLKR